jgi:hypothetical protein
MAFYNRPRHANFTIDPNAIDQRRISRSVGSVMAPTVIGLVVVVAAFALFYFYMWPVTSVDMSAPPSVTTMNPVPEPTKAPNP